MTRSRPPQPSSPESPPVAIVGAGPVGLALALGLARHGVGSLLLERKPTTSEYSKAPGIHVRTREVFRQWGVEERFLEAGVLIRRLRMHDAESARRTLLSVDFSDLEEEADRPGLLILEQARTEALLLAAVRETGLCDVRFGAEAVRLDAGADGARLTFRAGGAEHSLEAAYVVGCDGASSFVRSALGQPFEGMTYSVRPMLADVRISDDRDALPWPRFRNQRRGVAFAARLERGLWRLVHLGHGEPPSEDVSEEEVGERVAELLGAGPFDLVWASRFRIHRRASPRFRVGRVILAGDAAHVHSPAGGLGMNGGIHDAHNLAWKLAHALRGGDPGRLLDSYEIERRAVMVESAAGYADLITRGILLAPSAVRSAAFLLLRAAFRARSLRRRSLRRATMLDLDYPASPLLDPHDRSAGKRLPNPLLRAPDGAQLRLYDLLPTGAALLRIGAQRGETAAPAPVDQVIRIGEHAYADPSGRLRPLLGGDGWILVRPDAHVAWARSDPDPTAADVGAALGM